MTKIIAVTNQKGGVGKTTTSVHLAAGLTRFTKSRILVMDIGPQANTSSVFIGDDFVLERDFVEEPSMIDLLVDDQIALTDVAYEIELSPDSSGRPVTLDIVPAKRNMDAARNIFAELSRREYRLADKLYEFSQDRNQTPYDYIIIDCPPSLDTFNLNALVASTHVLIPVSPGEHNLKGVSQLLDTIEQANLLKRRNREAPTQILGIVFTMMNRTAISRDSRYKISTETDLPILAEVPARVAVQEAEAAHTDLFVYDPKNKATEAYKTLVKEVIRHG